MARVLIVVDVQKDFLPGGALAVAEGDQVRAVANRLAESEAYDLIVHTQDWHPANHGSFASNANVPLFSTFKLNGLDQVAWPDHCIQGSEGAEFAEGLEVPGFVLRKGKDPGVDSYSAFFDNGGQKETGLNSVLKGGGFFDLDVMGLATDYCVKYTVLDALRLGYKVRVVAEGCRAVGGETAHKAALEEMANAGAVVVEKMGALL